MERPKSEHMFGMMLESFHDLPSWKKIILLALSPLRHELSGMAKQAIRRTELVYA